MKKKRTLSKVVMATSVVAMGAGVFQAFNVEAETSAGGLCCQREDYSCYHPDNILFADSEWKSGIKFCP